MLSECARASTPAENRYRISAPNSRPRAVSVVSLDAASEGVVMSIAAQRPDPTPLSTTYRTAAPRPSADDVDGPGSQGWLRDLSGRAVDLIEEIERADLVVMIATAGKDVPAATVIGELCRLSGVTTTALVVGGPEPGEQSRSATLARIRPYSTMLVCSSSTDYVMEMLAALRA